MNREGVHRERILFYDEGKHLFCVEYELDNGNKIVQFEDIPTTSISPIVLDDKKSALVSSATNGTDIQDVVAEDVVSISPLIYRALFVLLSFGGIVYLTPIVASGITAAAIAIRKASIAVAEALIELAVTCLYIVAFVAVAAFIWAAVKVLMSSSDSPEKERSNKAQNQYQSQNINVYIGQRQGDQNQL